MDNTIPRRSKIINLLQGILWLLLFLPVNLYYNNILTNHLSVSIGVIIAIGLAYTAILRAKLTKCTLQITLSDILVVCYTCYILLNIFFVRPYPAPAIFWQELSFALLVYFFARMMTEKQQKIGLFIIMIAGLLESIFILLQDWGLLESRHLLFNFTGSFPNPGLTGGFIACSLCISIYFFTEAKKRTESTIILAISVLMLYSLILTNSRAGWLAAIIGCCYLLWHSEGKLLISIKQKLNKNIIFKALLFSSIILGLWFIYNHKKASADGRLFIWEISLRMVNDRPLTGYGIGTFEAIYPYYQADYFIEHPNSDRAMVAGNPSSPFNEYISILTTQGLLGIILFIAILLSLFLYRSNSNRQRKWKAFLLTICIFAIFSYPSDQFRLLILFPFFAALLPSKTIKKIGHRTFKYSLVLLLPLTILVLYFNLTSMHNYSRIQTPNDLSSSQYEEIKYDPLLLSYYYHFVDKYSNQDHCFAVLKDCVRLSPSTDRLCELGRIYKKLKCFSEAEDCFHFASNINPSLTTPNYELFLLHRENKDIDKMKMIGKKILNTSTKKEGTASLRMKAQVKKKLQVAHSSE